jgi:hypothetical protein
MKDGILHIVGKTIDAVVVATNERSPLRQVFLTFTDGTYFELYGDSLSGVGGLKQGDAEAARAYAQLFGGNIQVYSLSQGGVRVWEIDNGPLS